MLLGKDYTISSMLPIHWSEVATIYQEGLDTGLATFETVVPSYAQWDANHLNVGRLVALNQNEVLGWAALSSVSSRCVYGGVAEVSVYVSNRYKGLQIGLALLKQLIRESEKAGYWSLQSGIFKDNIASIKLHEKAGFRTIGFREKIGCLNGVWKDNLLMEYRSKTVGVSS